MADPFSADDRSAERLEQLCDEYLAAVRDGRDVDQGPFLRRFPEFADEIHELIESVQLMETFRHQESESRRAAGPHPLLGISRLSEFEIVKEIGRGGMGVVYEAIQTSLGRRVAIKVFHDRRLSAAHRIDRFQREAKAAARLHHTNIVPVFNVGVEQGIHFYVMQFIDGVGLDEVVDALRQQAGMGRRPRASLTRLVRNRSAESAAQCLQAGGFTSLSSQADQADVETQDARIDTLAAAGTHETDEQVAVARDDASAEDGPAEPRPDAILGHDSDAPHARATRQQTPPDSAQQRRSQQAEDADTRQAKTHREDVVFQPAYWKSIARLGLQLAHALDYAHQHGVFHRDVKPSNLLLDDQGTVWLTDFGVAKPDTIDDLTRTGDILGTLRYMAPEQMRGEAVAASDIYSLGLTLHELLTLRPGCTDEVLKARLGGRPATPLISPREMNRRIPRDLETIVLKATRTEVSGRYRDAGELAEDLQRFLNDQPIAARRVTSVERLFRWAMRNRALAASSLTTVACLILAAVLAFAGYVREARQRARAEAMADVAFDTLERIFAEFAPREFTVDSYAPRGRSDEGQPEGAPVDSESLGPESFEEYSHPPVISKEAARMLEGLLGCYDQLAAQVDDDERVIRQSALANRRVGEIHLRMGNYRPAQLALERAAGLYQQLEGRGEVVQLDLAKTYNRLGLVLASDFQHEEARASHLQALSVLEDRRESHDTQLQLELARSCYYLGQWDKRPDYGRTRRSRAYIQRAIDKLKPLIAETRNPDARLLMALCLHEQEQNDGRWRGRSPLPEPDETPAPSLEILRALVLEFPHVADYRLYLCQALVPSWMTRAQSVPEENLQEAQELSTQLLSQQPDVPAYLRNHVNVLMAIAHREMRDGHSEQATRRFREALATYKRFLERTASANLQPRIVDSLIRLELARSLAISERLTEAITELEAATGQLELLEAKHGELVEADRLANLVRFEAYGLLTKLHTLGGNSSKAMAARFLQSQTRRARDLDGRRPYGRGGPPGAGRRGRDWKSHTHRNSLPD